METSMKYINNIANRFYVKYWLGNFLTIGFIIFIELSKIYNIPIITPFALLILAVVISTSTGGLFLGLISTTLVSGYTFYSYLIGFGPLSLTGKLSTTVIGILIFYTQSIVLGVIKMQKDSTIDELEEISKMLDYQVRDREKKLKQALEKAIAVERGHALGKFATGITHDFNNLLQTIIGLAELALLEIDQPDEVKQNLNNIIKQSELGAKFIQQIMDFNRKSKIVEEDINLNEFLRDFVENAVRILPKQIDLQYINYQDPIRVRFDTTHLHQILLNMLANAKDAINDSTGKIRLILKKHEVDNLAILTIHDNGSGIPADILPHIFEPYVTTKNQLEGTGLGLAQVWGLIKQHNSEIEVESKVNQGTTFTIKIPCVAFKNIEN